MITVHLKKIIFSTLITLSFCYPVYATSADAPSQYKQHCTSCHERMTGGDGTLLYQRKDRTVKNYTDLIKRVHFCQRSIGLDWDQAQGAEVVNYLNESFYRFLMKSETGN